MWLVELGEFQPWKTLDYLSLYRFVPVKSSFQLVIVECFWSWNFIWIQDLSAYYSNGHILDRPQKQFNTRHNGLQAIAKKQNKNA